MSTSVWSRSGGRSASDGIPVLATWCLRCHSTVVFSRNVDGKTYEFGNPGGLYLEALSMYDLETGSFWSQISGAAVQGVLKGKKLAMLPASIQTWRTWYADRPETLVLELGAVTPRKSGLEPAMRLAEDAMIGVTAGGHYRGYHVESVRSLGIVNDEIGGMPVLVYVGPESRSRVYHRAIGTHTLTFEMTNGIPTDLETGSKWDLNAGIATDGTLDGKKLEQQSFVLSYGWTWQMFHPESSIYAVEE